MRVSSLVIIVLIVLAAFYIFVIQPQWAIDLYDKARGYGPAATAAESQDKFLKAIKNRDLKAAALFCTSEYAEQLKRGAAAAADMGPVLDGINSYMKNKGLDTDKSILLLWGLDPFPTNVKVRSAPKERDSNSAIVYFDAENILRNQSVQNPADFFRDLISVERVMFSTVLVPANLFNPQGVEAVKEGEGWKLKFAYPPIQVKALEQYLNNYKSYLTGLTVFRRDVTNDRYPGKSEFERELLGVMHSARGN